MAELREKGISLPRSGLMHFFWILGFVLYIGLIYIFGGGETWSGGGKRALSTWHLYSGHHQAINERQTFGY